MTPLQKLRKARNLTIYRVAVATGLDPANLSRIERGLQVPRKASTRALIEYFGHPLTELHILYPERYADFDPAAPSAAGQPMEKERHHDRSRNRKSRSDADKRGSRDRG